MTGSSTHQSISYLSRRFTEAGIRLNARHGQNFLIDLNLQRLIVERAELSPRDVVLEVGTGTGALTALMAPHAAAVVTVEIDTRLFQLASEELFGLGNVTMFCRDALKNKSHLDDQLSDVIRQRLAEGSDRQLKLVANLPYCVATPVMANLLAWPQPPVTMTVTVQKEVADRIAAAPGTKDYGALSVWVQSQCRVEMTRVLPPSVFWPRPQVTSAVIHLQFDPQLRAAVGNLEFFHEFSRSLFFHRRKFLRSVLISSLKGRLDKSGVDRVLAETGLDPESRADHLDVPAILALTHVVQATLAAEGAAQV